MTKTVYNNQYNHYENGQQRKINNKDWKDYCRANYDSHANDFTMTSVGEVCEIV